MSLRHRLLLSLTTAIEHQKRDSPVQSWLATASLFFFGAVLLWARATRHSDWWLIPVGILLLGLGFAVLRVMLNPLPPVVHTTVVEVDPPEAYATCSCGWVGEDRQSQDQAMADAQRHAPTSTPTVEVYAEETRELGYFLVSPEITEERQPILVMFRELPTNAADSGWRLYSATETQAESNDGSRLVRWTMDQVLERDSTVECVLHTQAPCAFSRERKQEQLKRQHLRYKGLPPN